MAYDALNKSIDTTAEIGSNAIRSARFSLGMEMTRPTRDGTVKLVSRDQMLIGANGDREVFISPIQLITSRIGNLTQIVSPYSCYM